MTALQYLLLLGGLQLAAFLFVIAALRLGAHQNDLHIEGTAHEHSPLHSLRND